MQMTGPYPSIIEWDIDQKSHIKKIITKEIHSQGHVYDIDLVKRKKVYLGHLDMTLSKTQLLLHHKNKLILNIKEISGIVITQKNRLSFDYLDKTYNIIMKDPMLYLDSILYTKGDVTWNNGQ
jgi:hypothetical protein